MSLPDFDTLATRAREIVAEARKDGSLRNLTPKLVFGRLEEEYGLESKAVSRSEHKEELRDIIRVAATEKPDVDDVDMDASENGHEANTGQSPEPAAPKRRVVTVESDEEFEEQESPKPAKKAPVKKAPAKKAAPKKRKAPAVSDSEKGVELEEESPKPKKAAPKKRKVSVASDEEDAEVKETKPRKPRSKPGSKKAASARPESSRRSSKQFTSAEFVNEDSDDDGPTTPSKSGPSSTKVDDTPKAKAEPAPAKKRTVSKPVSDDEVEIAEKPSNPKSDSESSVLDDEPPKKGRKSKPAKATAKASKEPKKRKGKAKEPLSKTEEKIERLKSYVRECGVRKVWAKEFKDLDEPSQRVARIEAILRDLGMTGRFTVQQAKDIRKRRELASELQDVQAYEKAHTGKKRQEEVQQLDDSDDDAPTAKRMTARARIAAFLADQSDDE
ncbi:hypothetical protein PENSPDRAFT_430443 [Peniophora sp. CONT]|nr:hypothetical protein PENSPDRAFT_430443 [Peniophora sp. CONT]